LIIDGKDFLSKTKTIADYHARIHLDLRIDISGKILYFAGSKHNFEITFSSEIMFGKGRRILDCKREVLLSNCSVGYLQ